MDNSKPKGIKDFESKAENPFSFPTEIEYRTRRATSVSLTDPETGETKVMNLNDGGSEGYFQDNRTFTKLFGDGAIRLQYLSAAGLKILHYIMANLRPNTELVTLPPARLALALGYSKSKAIYDGIVNLLENRFIAKRVGNDSEYYINYNFFFNGRTESLLDEPSRNGVRETLIRDNSLRKKTFSGK